MKATLRHIYLYRTALNESNSWDTFTCVGQLICPEGHVSSLNKSNPTNPWNSNPRPLDLHLDVPTQHATHTAADDLVKELVMSVVESAICNVYEEKKSILLMLTTTMTIRGGKGCCHPTTFDLWLLIFEWKRAEFILNDSWMIRAISP